MIWDFGIFGFIKVLSKGLFRKEFKLLSFCISEREKPNHEKQRLAAAGKFYYIYCEKDESPAIWP